MRVYVVICGHNSEVLVYGSWERVRLGLGFYVPLEPPAVHNMVPLVWRDANGLAYSAYCREMLT